MNDLFLSQVRIKDFRSFGEFEVDIPPGPGLTLVVGANGFGKSSFFDAIEWALTGKVQRLVNYLSAKTTESQYLLRRDAKGPHGVGLTFSNGATVDRVGPKGPDPQTVISLLKDPEWNEIKDLAGYLAFTHFLGQGEAQRFTSRRREDQWKALEGPSGIDRLEDIRKGLRGPATTRAFTRRIKDETAAVDELKMQLAQWRDLMTRLASARDASAASGGLDPQILTSRIQALDQSLTHTLNVLPGLDETPLTAVTRQLTQIQQGRAAVQEAVRRLGDFEAYPQRYTVESANAALTNPTVIAAQEAAAEARSALDQSLTASTEAKTRFDAAALSVANRRLQMGLIEVQASQRSDLAGAVAELALLKQSKHDDEAARSTAEAAESLLSEQIEGARGRAEMVAGYAVAAEAARAAAEDARAMDVAQQHRQSQTEAAQSILVAGNAARALLSELHLRRDALAAEQTTARAALEEQRRRSSALAAAVAQVAAHLDEHDADCPVCQSKIGAGLLLATARASAEAQDQNLALAEQYDNRLSDDLSRIRQEMAAAQVEIDAADRQTTVLAVLDADLAAREADIRQRLQAPATATDLVELADQHNLNAGVKYITALEATAGDAVILAEGAVRMAALVSDRAAISLRLSQTDQKISQAEARRDSLQQSLAEGLNGRLTDDEFAAFQKREAEALEAAVQAAHAAQDASTSADAGLVLARTRHDAAAAAYGAAEASRLVSEASARGMADAWSREGFDGLPNVANLQLHRAKLLERAAEIERFEDERSQLVLALETESQRAELQSLSAQMSAIGGEMAPAQPSVYEGLILAQLVQAEATLLQTRKTAALVRSFSGDLQEKAKTFSSQFLTPLNDLIGTYNDALLSSPGDFVQFEAENRLDSTRFQMALKRRNRVDNLIHDTSLPPQAILSEGQIAANGFSILCSASTAYPWSSWRALLMDDPLQHNDIIHAAAFVDLMRNLVELKDYQLLMSTHDRSEADFITRKFDAAGLPCRVVELTTPAKSGVRYELPTPNLAAQALLRQKSASAPTPPGLSV